MNYTIQHTIQYSTVVPNYKALVHYRPHQHLGQLAYDEYRAIAILIEVNYTCIICSFNQPEKALFRRIRVNIKQTFN